MTDTIMFTARLEDGEVVWEDSEGNPAKSHKVHVPKGHPQHTIEYSIKDQTGLGLKFDKADAIHVWEQQGCPPPGIATDQIDVVQAGSDKVTILNRNSGPPRRLQYQLNVLAENGARWPCDPIIHNDGGGNIG